MAQVLLEPQKSLMSISFLLGLLSASSGLAAIMRQMNLVFEMRETRSIWHARFVAIMLTALLTLVIAVALLVIVLGGMFFDGAILTFLRWLVGFVTVYSAIAIIYFVGPNFELRPRIFTYFSPGAWLSTIFIMAATGLLSLYVAHFDSYNKVYGSLAGVIILMVWFYLLGLALLMGAQLNHFIAERAIYFKIARKFRGTTEPAV
jgi:membrane protein